MTKVGGQAEAPWTEATSLVRTFSLLAKADPEEAMWQLDETTTYPECG